MYPQSSFIIKHYDGFGGNFVDSQYLGHAYNTETPHIFQNTQMRMYSAESRFFGLKPLIALTGGVSNVLEVDAEVYRWTLQGAEEKLARVIENVEPSNTTPGLNNTTFRIKLDLDYFSHPDVLFSEDNEFPLAIMDGPIQDGTGYIYTVRIQTDNPTFYLDPKNLEPGRKFSRVWTSVPSEANDVYGTQQAPSSMLLESQLGFFAHKISVTDRAHRASGRLGVEFSAMDSNGKVKKIEKFIPFYEARMRDEFYKEMEVQMVYGKKSTYAGKNGYFTKTGFNGPLLAVMLAA